MESAELIRMKPYQAKTFVPTQSPLSKLVAASDCEIDD
jgi:hypothetical protein